MTERIEAGEVRRDVDRCYRLDRLPDVLRPYGEGHARGKVALDLARPVEGDA